MTNIAPLRTPAKQGSLLCKLGSIYVVSFYLITRHNSLIITEGWVSGASTPVFETPSPEGLPTKAKEDPSPHEMRLSPTGHQPSISWSWGFIVIIIIIIIIVIIIIIMQRFYILGFQSLHLPIKKIDKYLQIHVMETKSKEEWLKIVQKKNVNPKLEQIRSL